ncbi:MAG: type IV pilus secretin PilQ [Thermodesulfobacteriota bacterium]
MIGGCAQKKAVKKEEAFFDKWKIMAESSRGYSPSSKKPADKQPTATPPEISKPAAKLSEVKPAVEPERQLPTTPVSMKMHDIDVTVLLRALAKAADQNIMVNEKVKGKANINISKAPWDQVFKGLLRTHGLTYSWEGDIIRIMTVEDMEQDLKRETQKLGFRLVAPLTTQVLKINYTEAAKLKVNLEKFLTLNAEGKPMGSIMVDEHTNSLIIQAIQADIDAILPIIEKLDRPTPQILIEAHIVEATKDTARELGIQWGGLNRSGFWITPGLSSADLGTKLSAGGIDPTPGWAANFPAASITNTPAMTIGFAVEDIGSSIIAAQLSALQKDNKINILSSPSITTLDNQKAIIESGTDSPYQSVEEGNVKVEYKKATLSLEVTPHVIDGRMLRMQIKTKKDEIGEKGTLGPTIITKMAETNVLLFDGQTTVIGGLTKEKTDKTEAGVPSLKDIPLLGWLFKSDSDKGAMEDLLIFITPHILKEDVSEANELKPNQSPSTNKPEAVPQ